jgi:ADP-heptose:LPS heptosyltransferase
MGDVLLTGPAVRAVAAGAARVTFLAGPNGSAAAGLLPGVDEVLTWRLPWIDPVPSPVARAEIDELVRRIAARRPDQAVVLTSFHQSALPTALLLRLAGVGVIAAESEDYPGSLLDVRHHRDAGLHEVEAALGLVATLGYRLPAGDDGRLRIQPPGPSPVAGRYVVLHPGASVPARAWPAGRHAELAAGLAARGRQVVVTGGASERDLTATVAAAAPGSLDLAGRLDLAGLAAVLAGADAVVVGNTGPAHLAAAVGTPVVSLFAPVVPAGRWRPWGVPCVVLGDQDAACAGSRAKVCPVPGHPCLAGVGAADALAALEELAPVEVGA